MRIGMVSKFLPEKDGIARFSENLCNELSKQHEVIRIGDTKSSTADYKINFKSFRLKAQLQRIIEKENLDLLHVQYIAAYFGRSTLNLNLLQALSQKIPVVSTMHEIHYSYEGYNFLRKSVLKFLEKEVVRKSNAVIAHTSQQKRFLEKKYGKNNVFFIHLGLELLEFHKRKDLNVLFFGKISRMKGLELLLRAMKMLPDVKLQIAGSFVDKKYEKRVRNLVDGMENVKSTFGWVSDGERWRYFKNADLAVFPYLKIQNQSGALNDAVSAGIPVVVTKAGALGETVEHFKFGEVVERSPRAIANGIRKAFKNYGSYRKGLNDYRKEANWKAVAEKHTEMYKKLMAAGL